MRRVILGFVIAAMLCLGFVGESLATTVKEYAVIINLAGRQRMLTQKMSKEMFLVANGVEVANNREALKKTIALFDTTLKGLIKGDKALGIPATIGKGELRQMGKVEGLWAEFKTLADSVVSGGSVPVAKVAELNLPLLKNMNTAVRLYEKAAKKEVSMAAGAVINLAGKQRMLTQKMSKELLLVALGHNVDENKINLKKSGSLFDRTLKGLKSGDEDLGLPATTDAAINAQLDTVSGLWKEFKPLVDKVSDIDSGSPAKADIEKMAKLNLPLLKEMNKAVKMYEKAQ